MNRTTAFYDRLASHYHLIFEDWDQSIERQATQLTSIIEERWGTGKEVGPRRVVRYRHPRLASPMASVAASGT